MTTDLELNKIWSRPDYHLRQSCSEVGSFKELHERIVLNFPTETGSPSAFCEQTGDDYKEILVRMLSRQRDVKLIERKAASEMGRQLETLFYSKQGTVHYPVRGKIYWRCPLEWEISRAPQIVRLSEDGPDIDFITNQRCYMDHDWMAVKAYCRLSVSKGEINAQEG